MTPTHTQKFVELPDRAFKLGELLAASRATAGQMENWMRQGILVPFKDARSSGDHRIFSLQNVIEAAQARTLAAIGMSARHLEVIFTTQRQKLDAVRPELRASATFVFYVQQVKAAAQLTGGLGPDVVQWLHDADTLLRKWNAKTRELDVKILHLVAAQAATDRQGSDANRP